MRDNIVNNSPRNSTKPTQGAEGGNRLLNLDSWLGARPTALMISMDFNYSPPHASLWSSAPPLLLTSHPFIPCPQPLPYLPTCPTLYPYLLWMRPAAIHWLLDGSAVRLGHRSRSLPLEVHTKGTQQGPERLTV